MEIFRNAWLLLDLIHKSTGVNEAKPLRDLAMAELKRLGEMAVAPKAIPNPEPAVQEPEPEVETETVRRI
jgi:hypothetical protein